MQTDLPGLKSHRAFTTISLMQSGFHLAIILCAALTLVGCGRVALQGRVTTIQGEALPGVAVFESTVDDGRLTSARGRYRLTRSAGPVLLRFSKTGYCPAELELNVKPGTSMTVPEIRMWRLPERAGVYILDESGYTETTWVNPKNFFMAEGGMAYATQREPATTAIGTAPQIICYKTPRYNARLSRLRRAKAKLGAGDTQTFDVWTAGGTIPVDLVPVDEPEGMLLRLRTEQALDPGVYAVHWGALDGYTTLESRAFMLTIAAEEVAPVVLIPEPVQEEPDELPVSESDSESPGDAEPETVDTEVLDDVESESADPAPEQAPDTEATPDPTE